MAIYNAILKYGRENFLFEIIEYCQPEEAIQREQYYLDNFDFDYNILENAKSMLGYKHTAETLAKMRGRQNALGYKHSPETLDLLRELQTNQSHSLESKEKMREIWAERKLKANEQEVLPTAHNNELEGAAPVRKKNKGKLVIVTNVETNMATEYVSISEAALALNITRTTLRTYIKNKTVFVLLKQNPSGNSVIKENYLISIKDD